MNLGPNQKLDDLIHKQLRKIQLERLHGAPVNEPREPVKVVKSMKAKKEKKIRARIKALKKKAKLQLKKGNLKKYKKVAQEIKRLDQKLGTLPTKLSRTKVLKKLGGPKAKKLGKRESMKQISSYIDSKTDKKISEIYDLKGLKMELKKVLFMAAKERENVDPTRYNSLLRRANELKRQLTNVKEISKEIKKSVSVPEVLKQLQQESVYETIYGKDNVPLISRKPSEQPIKPIKPAKIPIKLTSEEIAEELEKELPNLSNDQLDDLIDYNTDLRLDRANLQGDIREGRRVIERANIVKTILSNHNKGKYIYGSLRRPEHLSENIRLVPENVSYLNNISNISYNDRPLPPLPPRPTSQEPAMDNIIAKLDSVIKEVKPNVNIPKILKEVKNEAKEDIEEAADIARAEIDSEIDILKYGKSRKGKEKISDIERQLNDALIAKKEKERDRIDIEEQILKNKLENETIKAAAKALLPEEEKSIAEQLYDEVSSRRDQLGYFNESDYESDEDFFDPVFEEAAEPYRSKGNGLRRKRRIYRK